MVITCPKNQKNLAMPLDSVGGDFCGDGGGVQWCWCSVVEVDL
jgi:hypothetical protein